MRATGTIVAELIVVIAIVVAIATVLSVIR